MKDQPVFHERARRARVVGVLALLALGELVLEEPAWPRAPGRSTTVRAAAFGARSVARPGVAFSREDDLVRGQPFCVAGTARWFGALGDVVLYRYERRGNVLDVGYFVYFTTERPWGDNELTRRVYPALALDAFYSHFAFVLPGAQRLLYGPGDIEGVLVRYRIEGERLVPERALADDEGHHSVQLGAEEVRADSGEVVVLTETWSHQLGARHAAERFGSVEHRCFDAGHLAPLSREVAAEFRLGNATAPQRAKPAWRRSDP